VRSSDHAAGQHSTADEVRPVPRFPHEYTVSSGSWTPDLAVGRPRPAHQDPFTPPADQTPHPHPPSSWGILREHRRTCINFRPLSDRFCHL